MKAWDTAASPAVSLSWHSRAVEKLSNQQILDAGLADWRKLAQALHARYSVPDTDLSPSPPR